MVKRTVSAEILSAENNKLSLGMSRIKDGKRYELSATLKEEIPDGAVISFCHGKMMSYGRWLEIDSKVLKYLNISTKSDSPVYERAFEHGLTLKGKILLEIIADPVRNIRRITLKTADGEYSIDEHLFNSCNGEVCVMADGVELYDVTLSLEVAGYSHDIWIIGASYLSLFDPSRWPYYWYAEGGAGPLLMGRGGMGAQHGIEDLTDALKYGTPKILMWESVSGNNADKDGVASPIFYENTLKMLEICKEKGIKVYIQTMPNAPFRTNFYKNEIILNKALDFKNYDYEVVDLARALDAKKEKNPSWFPGMICGDNIHPYPLGARAAYLATIVDAPELILGRVCDVYKADSVRLSSEVLSISENVADEFALTFRADFDGDFEGKLTIGNEADGNGSYVEIDGDCINAYSLVDGKVVLVSTAENPAIMKKLLNLRIKVKDGKASLALMSAGEKNLDVKKRTLDTLEFGWNTVGSPFVKVEGNTLVEARLKLAK